MIRLGLTGSIGMGKSTTAAMFGAEGVPVFDSDAAVHEVYAGPAVSLVESAFPGTTADGRVDRQKLSARVVGNPEALARLEALVHPLVGEARQRFMDRAAQSGARAVLLDVPLLFETGGADRVDAVVVVSAPAGIQRERVLARPGMTEAKLEAILARQLPDAEKRRRADYVIDTGQGLDAAREQVRKVVADVLRPDWIRPRRI
jgi:dephospho-CoA kinase